MERRPSANNVDRGIAPSPEASVVATAGGLGGAAGMTEPIGGGPELDLDLVRVYPAVREAVPEARRSVADLAARAGVAGASLDAVRLAVSEAVSNVVRHAYLDSAGTFTVSAAVCDDELCVLVADDGRGHRSPTQNPGLGLGLALIADACDHFALAERAAGGTEAQMRFSLSAAIAG